MILAVVMLGIGNFGLAGQKSDGRLVGVGVQRPSNSTTSRTYIHMAKSQYPLSIH